MKSNEKIWSAVAVLICLIYVWLRLRNLTDSCLWFDEIFSVHAASLSWREMFWFVAQDLIHPPLFYALLKIWSGIGGESLWWLRLFPVLFSTLALIPLYLLCRRLNLKDSTIILTFALFACNGALIKYAQEVRMYAVLLCFAMFSTWLFVRYVQTNKGFVWLIALNMLLTYTHYFGWFIVAAEIMTTAVLYRDKLKQILTMSGILLLSFAPWIYALYQAAQINSDVAQNIGWMSKPNLVVLWQFALDLIEPFYFQSSNAERASIYFISIPLLIILFVVSYLFLNSWRKQDETVKINFVLLLIFIKLPILLAFTASWILPNSIFGTRHLIIVFAPLMILTAVMIEKINLQKIKVGIIAVILVLFSIAFILEIQRQNQTFIWCAWENLATNLEENKPENSTKVYVFEDLTAYHFWFALRETGKNFQVVKINNVNDLIEDKAYFLPRGFDGVSKIKEDEISENDFYIAFRATEWNLQKPPLKNLLDKGYRIGELKVYEAQGLKAFLVEVQK